MTDPVRFRLEQEIRYDYSAPVANLTQRLVVVPRVSHGAQRRHFWQLSVEGADSARRKVVRDEFENLTVEVQASGISCSVSFTLETEVERQPSGDAPLVAGDPRLGAATRLTAADAGLKALAAEAGPHAEPGDICSLVHRSMAYEWGVTGVRTTAAEALAGGKGVCQDYAHVMLAVCRILGLPARYVSGHLLGEGGSHAWVEVLRAVPGLRRWRAEAWDPTHDRRVGIDYLTVAVGRDYADVMPMSGTYDSPRVANTLKVSKRLTAA